MEDKNDSGPAEDQTTSTASSNQPDTPRDNSNLVPLTDAQMGGRHYWWELAPQDQRAVLGEVAEQDQFAFFDLARGRSLLFGPRGLDIMDMNALPTVPTQMIPEVDQEYQYRDALYAVLMAAWYVGLDVDALAQNASEHVRHVTSELRTYHGRKSASSGQPV